MGIINTRKQIITKISIAILFLISGFFVGYKVGVIQANKQYKVEIPKESQKEHEKKIQSIRTESDSAAIKRFRDNFSPKQ